MFGLFKEKICKTAFFDKRIDMHSHILCGVDDGAQTIEDSQAIINELRDLGFAGAYCTPHIMATIPRNTPDFLRDRFEEMKGKLDLGNFDLRLAGEYMLDDQFLGKLAASAPLVFEGNRILVEFSQVFVPNNWQEMIYQVKEKGLVPILAHPERCWHLFSDPTDEDMLISQCEFQLNILSLSGFYGETSKKCAIRLMNRALYSYIGTDTHGPLHLQKIKKLSLPASLASALAQISPNRSAN